MKYTLYALKCPIAKQVRYIGVTKDIDNRMVQHCQVREGNYFMKEWKLLLRKRNKKMILITLEELDCTFEKAIEIEKTYIKLFVKCGIPLLNDSHGGAQRAKNFTDFYNKYIKEKTK